MTALYDPLTYDALDVHPDHLPDDLAGFSVRRGCLRP